MPGSGSIVITPSNTTESKTRIIRVCINRTFRDFMQERDPLGKWVLQKLRRKARKRVKEEVVITEEESR